MQRLPRYVLLLTELKKRTEKFNSAHADLGDLKRAIEAIKYVTATVSFIVYYLRKNNINTNNIIFY